MDPQDHLVLAKAIPGEDQSWLAPGWLEGSNIDSSARRTVVDWLIQVQQYLSLSDATLHLAVANFDLVLSLVDFDMEEIQLLGLASLQLAAKVEEDCAPAPSLLVPLTGGAYSKQDLARMELEVIQTLNWRLRRTTSCVFLHYYSEISGKEKKPVFKLARAILDLCLLETWCGTLQPSHLASTALLAASHFLGKGWTEDLANITGHKQLKLMVQLDKVMAIVNRGQVGEGINGKHGKVLRKVTDIKSANEIVNSVREDLARNKVNTGPGL